MTTKKGSGFESRARVSPKITCEYAVMATDRIHVIIDESYPSNMFLDLNFHVESINEVCLGSR